MAILIKPLQKVNPKDLNATDRKWYVSQVTSTQVDETQVAMEVAEETTLNPSEAMMAIRQLRKIVLRHLLSSESVKFGNWGNFNITISSTGSDTKKDVSTKNIKSVNLIFQPDEQFKADLNKASFAWVDKLAEGRPKSSSGKPSAPGDDDVVDSNPDTPGGGTGGDGTGEGDGGTSFD